MRSDQKAFQVADLVLLSRHAGKDTDTNGSAELLCLVEKVTRTGGRREQCTVEVLVCAAMKGSGTPHAAASSSANTARLDLILRASYLSTALHRAALSRRLLSRRCRRRLTTTR